MKIKKVLLVTPPAYTFKAGRDINPLPPMGLGYIASVLESMNIEVNILDCLIRGWNHEDEVDGTLIRVGLSDAEIEKYIKDFNPDIVGINCQFSRQYKIYHHMFSLVKKILPECITVAGGPHATVCPKEVLQDSACDYILMGEAEDSFKELISNIDNGKSISSIDGLGWKENGTIHINEKKKWITNLDTLPFPAYHLMNLDMYFGLPSSHGTRHKARFSPIITSRGCPAKCTFCSALKVWGNAYRFRSIENVLSEMRLLKDKYGIEELMFEDDNVTANLKRARELFNGMIREKFNFVWDTPNGVGVWSLDNDTLDLIKEAGCVRLNFPVESGSQNVLDNIIKKPLKLDRVKSLLKHCHKIGLDCGMFLVIGMPGEKIEDMWKSIKFAAECGCYTPHISVATPYPGSELFKTCSLNGYFSREFSLGDLFIRSFLIETPDWKEKDLKKVLTRSLVYLKVQSLIHNPMQFAALLIKYIKNPISLFRHLGRLF